MKIKLFLRRLADTIEEITVEQFPLVIGRSPEADIRLEDRWVSRRHCEIDTRDGVLLVRDLGSKHGTLLNDSHIGESPLRPGDTLSVGLSTLVASYESGVGVTSTP